jgi:class 3 adenylate cyclase
LLRTDASDALPLIAAPTLVVHNAGDNILPVAGAREAARAIPHARLVELPYDVHCDWAGNSIHAAIDVIEPFLAGQITPPVRTQRQLATVLFTDIVDSTGETRRRGDERWQRLLDELDAVTARAAADQSGRVVKSTGDGALCVFDGPGRAVTAALAVTRAAAARGIALRSGVHCGEVELRDNDLGGIAVHLAARIQEAAAPGEIVVSRTIVDLTFGSDLRFSERGAVTLRGFDQPWELFAVSA